MHKIERPLRAILFDTSVSLSGHILVRRSGKPLGAVYIGIFVSLSGLIIVYSWFDGASQCLAGLSGLWVIVEAFGAPVPV